MNLVDYPVSLEKDGIKLQTEKMEIDKLYYCMYQEKLMLFFKDKNELLNCYEVEDKEIIEAVRQEESVDIDKVLEDYIKKKNLK